MITESERREISRMRAEFPFIGIENAVRIVRYQNSEPTPYEFVKSMSDWPTPPERLSGEIDGMAVMVKIEYDQDSQVGDDDVTGWFTNTYEPGCITNTLRNWGTDYKWYRPSNSRLSADGGWQWWHDHYGASKSVARDIAAKLIKDDMKDDAERSYLGIVVEISLDGREVGSASLWSIDVGSTPSDSRSYLIETTTNLIDEALGEVAALRESLKD